MKHIDIKNILIDDSYIDKELVICGWIKTIRKTKQYFFIELSDGTSMQNLQIIVDKSDENLAKVLENVTTGTTIKATGKIVKSNTYKQNIEMVLHNVELLGTCSNDYPLQKKKQNLETLRELPHLRSRTNTISAVLKVRSTIMRAIHEYMEQLNFTYVNTPIITRSNCEGAGEMFQVTTLNVPFVNEKNISNTNIYKGDFFGRKVNLTLSGQLEVESLIYGLGKAYNLGPCFRAEDSNTKKHAAEFWLMEAEIAFANMYETINVSTDLVKFIAQKVLEKNYEEILFLNKFHDENLEQKIIKLIKEDFEIIEYDKAIQILKNSCHNFSYEVSNRCDLKSEHYNYLMNKYIKKPFYLTNYPKEFKPFYIKETKNENVLSADLYFPNLGDVIGVSEKEENYETLKKKIKELGMPEEEYNWYLDLRKYGSVPHSGFGLGIERLTMYLTSMENIRDTIPFPRTKCKSLKL